MEIVETLAVEPIEDAARDHRAHEGARDRRRDGRFRRRAHLVSQFAPPRHRHRQDRRRLRAERRALRSTIASSCARWSTSRAISASRPSPNGWRTPKRAGCSANGESTICRAISRPPGNPRAAGAGRAWRRRGVSARRSGQLFSRQAVEAAPHLRELRPQLVDIGARRRRLGLRRSGRLRRAAGEGREQAQGLMERGEVLSRQSPAARRTRTPKTGPGRSARLAASRIACFSPVNWSIEYSR